MTSNQDKLDAIFNGQQDQISYDGNHNPFTDVIKGMRTDVHDLAQKKDTFDQILSVSIENGKKLDTLIGLLTPKTTT